METASADVPAVGQPSTPPQEAWIIVCEDFHGAVGPIPTERLALGLAAEGEHTRVRVVLGRWICVRRAGRCHCRRKQGDKKHAPHQHSLLSGRSDHQGSWLHTLAAQDSILANVRVRGRT